jgi:hypothetical protein
MTFASLMLSSISGGISVFQEKFFVSHRGRKVRLDHCAAISEPFAIGVSIFESPDRLK